MPVLMNLFLKRLLWIAVIGVGTNYLWEMLQMPFFQMDGWGSLDSWILCFEATLGDTFLILVIYGIGVLIFRDGEWLLKMNVAKVFYLLIIGSLIAVYFEVTALLSSRWQYSELMPVMPILGVGVIPYIQMLILPYISIRVGLRLTSSDGESFTE